MAITTLRGKTVLITGAASGIGYECALAFGAAGANLVLTDIDLAGAEHAASDAAREGVQTLARRVDVADEAGWRELAAVVNARFGALDVLVNNAGIGYLGPFLGTSTEAWRWVLGVNVMGVVHGCQAFLPEMIRAGGPRHIVNIASAAGYAPTPNMSAYAATKFAVKGLSEVLRMELIDTEVGVTTVCPGIIHTNITQSRRAISPDITDRQLAALQDYYQKNGWHPSRVARRIVSAVQRGEELVLVGPYARPMYHLQRFSRGLVRRLSIASARKFGFI
jgi:NAD(P)-dependent dehydrogenase (short-subunit alcohol dehydrogenase family)